MKINTIIIDEFLDNPDAVRNSALELDFYEKGQFPGSRSDRADEEYESYIQKKIEKILNSKIKSWRQDSFRFQLCLENDDTWVHSDGIEWAGVLFLTPDAPLSSGTAFYEFYDGTQCARDMEILKNKEEIDKYSQDLTKWKKVDQVGNVFNRLILFNANRFHMSMDYFGDSKENGRLFQVFFFSTER